MYRKTFDVIDIAQNRVAIGVLAGEAIEAMRHARFEALAYDDDDNAYDEESLFDIVQQEAVGGTK